MAQGSAISIGNFDGVHAGHAALIRAARLAVGAAGRVVALTFEPHPMTVLAPARVPARLSIFTQRQRWLLEAGADEVGVLVPTSEFLNQSPEVFIESICRRHDPSVIVEGTDFRFGHRRAGSVDTLRRLQAHHGYRTIVLDPVEIDLQDQSVVPAGSSLVRWLISQGRVADSARVLGRPYEMECLVVRGDQRGRHLGMPTANLDHGDYVLPADGVYAGTALRPDGASFAAAISVGSKPTFNGGSRTCEAHLLDYDGAVDEYGWTIRLRFTHWLRDQLIFAGVEPLMAQLRRDVQRVRSLAAAAGSSQPLTRPITHACEPTPC